MEVEIQSLSWLSFINFYVFCLFAADMGSTLFFHDF